jgi:WD40 repeat protein
VGCSLGPGPLLLIKSSGGRVVSGGRGVFGAIGLGRPAGQRGIWDDPIKLWDARSGRLLHSLEGRGGRVKSVALSASGDLLAGGFEDGTLKL